MDWLEKSKFIDSLDLEVCFQIQDKFYIGCPNSHEQLQDDKFYEDLDLPSFERVVPTLIRTSEANGHIDELVSYYRKIIVKSIARDQSFNEIRSYFWLRLWLWNTAEDVHISFPWYDSLSEMQNFFSWLQGNSEQPYIDIDQGWQVDAARVGENVHIRQIDPDCDEEYANVSVPYAKIIQKVSEVESRAQHIISNLSKELGVDVWSQYIKDVNFGTKEWILHEELTERKKSNTIFSRLFRS